MGNIIESLEDFLFHHNIQTRWKDMDSFGHINNAVYLTYIEDARTTLFKRWNFNSQNKSVIVASLKIDYFTQIKHPSKLIIGSKISRIGNSSFDIQSAIFIDGLKKPAALSLVICVCYDYEDGQSVTVYDKIRNENTYVNNKIIDQPPMFMKAGMEMVRE